MNFLYIDTSSNYLYVGIVHDDNLIAEKKINYGKDMSKFALNTISNLFNTTNLLPTDINKIIVVDGPGSFTGIRIGMTFAKIYAWTLNKDITTISSLDAMAASVSYSKYIVPIIDARRGYVYAGIYKGNEIIFSNNYIKFDDLLNNLKKLDDDFVFVSNQLTGYDNILKYNPDIFKIVSTYKNKNSINPHLIEPKYLKLTEAEENLRNSRNNDN